MKKSSNILKFDPEFTNNLKAFSDEALLDISIHKPEAFAELVDRYERAFMRKALSILGNEDDAYDAVQEAFVRMYAGAKKFKKLDGASLSSWAYKILVNRCKTIYTKNRARRTVSFEAEPSLLETIPDEVSMSDGEKRLTREYVLSMISKLPELLRRMVIRHFIEGIPQRDIAKEERISNNAIRARIHRAKKELRRINLSLEFDRERILVPVMIRNQNE
ncbi:MAG: RNA polymerase sigma factor [Candidatus Paceibacterota bacterium]|jgi:RNA polymerase sigma-70 factor (ECF subfamily)